MLTLVAGLGLAALGGAAAQAVRWSWLVARPDEWLLRIRDGRLVRAGIGISVWRRPGDAIVRFTSAIQRVTFQATAPSRDQVPFVVDGFALWTVRAEGDGPFAGYRNLGLANLADRPAQLKSDKHLLTGPQYHAFQALLAAEVQELVATIPAASLLADRAGLAEAVAERLERLAASLGFRIARVEVSGVRPLDATLGQDLGAKEDRAIREAAERARLESHERVKHLAIESEARLAAEAHARATAQKVVEEESLRRLSEERRVREESELVARLDRRRREAEAERDALVTTGEAQERKSPAVREHELATFTAGKVADALAHLPLKEARWVSLGDAPLETLTSMIAGLEARLVPPKP